MSKLVKVEVLPIRREQQPAALIAASDCNCSADSRAVFRGLSRKAAGELWRVVRKLYAARMLLGPEQQRSVNE